MALTDYRKLCPNSGHALSLAERRALDAGGRRARSIRCDACGRVVEVCPDPGTGQSLLYAMHLKDGVGTAPCEKGAA